MDNSSFPWKLLRCVHDKNGGRAFEVRQGHGGHAGDRGHLVWRHVPGGPPPGAAGPTGAACQGRLSREAVIDL